MIENSADIISALPIIPFKFNPEKETLEWCNISSVRFNEPFFEETIRKCFREKPGKSETIITPVNILKNLNVEPLKINGFIFHVSRCGSTLVSQAFSVLPQCKVLSEPPVLDEFLFFLHNTPGVDKEEKKFLFKKLVHVLGRKIFPEEKYLIIKFDSWHLEYIDFIREVFPRVPVVFLYRDPIKVILSHKRIRGMQMIPGVISSKFLQIDYDDIPPAELDLYAVRVLEKVYHAAIEIYKQDKNILLVNYKQLPAVIWEKLLNYSNISVTSDNIDAMKERTRYNAKDGNEIFTEIKMELPEDISAAASLNLTGLYKNLEELRKKQGAS